jgi:hypothetical protein
MKSNLLALLFFSCSLSFSQWSMTAGPYDNRSINVLQPFHGRLYAGIEGGGVYVTTDNGSSWYTIGKGLLNSHILAATVRREKLYVGTQYGVHVLNESDQSWTSLGPFGNYIWALASTDSAIFAGTAGSGVYRSTDEGSSWVPVVNGLGDNSIKAMVARGTTLLAATQSKGVYRSTDFGGSWAACNGGLDQLWCYAAGTSGAGFFVSTLENTYFSGNDGLSWVSLSPALPGALGFASSDSLFFTATTQNGIRVSKDNGLTWDQGLSGLEGKYCESVATLNGYLFAGSFSDWIWKRPVSEVTSVPGPGDVLPFRTRLEQNYPNPFNPATTIRFAVGAYATRVRLAVYDLLGREVALLVDDIRPAGLYETTWNAGIAPSGTYLCRLVTGETTISMKMVFLR